MLEAVIPAAGRGVRFLPLTKEQPKELLPVVDRPVIHYVVEEASRAHIDKVLIITGRHKRSLLEDYFDSSPDLERLEGGNVASVLSSFDHLPKIHFTRQAEPRGLGDAILRAKAFVSADEGFFAVMLGDTINVSRKPVVGQLIDAYRSLKGVDGVIAVEEVKEEKVRDYGIVEPGGKCCGGRGCYVRKLIEKPSPSQTTSRLGITGTYVLSKKVFDYLEKVKPDKRGEIQLTDALQLMVEQGLRIVGYRFEGKRYDIGDMMTWMKANLELSFLDPRYGARLREHAASLLGKEPAGGRTS
ncbi:MAG TPA: sugar phosphate nucleotidyltransferase [Conexivisphaerales archaeon]|nr:sugar phosphate nucleotidyltransferase [Conexivisphaerales archaeon]